MRAGGAGDGKRAGGPEALNRLAGSGSGNFSFPLRLPPAHAPRMDFLAKARQVIEIETGALQRMANRLEDGFARAVEILHETLDRRGKIVVVGIGKSGNIGHKIAATLNSTGATAVVLNSQNALHGDLGLVSDGDAVLLLSYSGETVELLDLLPHVKRFDVGMISLTGNPRSTLAEHSDVVLDTSVDREACPMNLSPSSSSTAMLVMGDAHGP